MKKLALLFLAMWILLQNPSRADDTEPLSRPQLTVILQAVGLLERSHIDELKSGYDASGKMSYYLKNATLLGRIKAAKNPLIALELTFIRSSPDFTDRLPARGHTFIVFFDDNMDLMCWKIGGSLKGSHFIDEQGPEYNLSDPKQYSQIIPDRPLILRN